MANGKGIKAFIFRTTTVCDKQCLVCCNNQQRLTNVMSYDGYKAKLKKIGSYADRMGIDSVDICLTGGEALLYRAKTSDGCAANIFDLVRLARKVMPTSKIMIKTSGWLPNSPMDRLFNEHNCQFPADILKYNLGFNMYQSQGRGGASRLEHMVDTLLSRQRSLFVETVYDKDNFEETFAALTAVIGKHDQRASLARRFVERDPAVPKRLEFRVDGKELTVITGPAYSPSRECEHLNFWPERLIGGCARIAEGPDCIYYNYDLALYHCNDSFVDANLAPIPSGKLPSIEAEQKFLRDRFVDLKLFLEREGRGFADRKERCFFCTKFVMDDQQVDGQQRWADATPV